MSSLRMVLWQTIGQSMFACTLHNAYKYRTWLLKRFGMKCGYRVRARRNVRFTNPWNIEAGDLTIFGDCAVVNATKKIVLGKRCVVSQYAMLITTSGDTKTQGRTLREGSITIEDDCWVATDAIVMPGSHIEQGVVVGARGLVEGRLPKWTICTGEPAVSRGERVLYAQK